MTIPNPDCRLPRVPRIAVCGEIITALCLGFSGLFLPLGYWTTWPELLVNSHYAVAFLGTLVLACSLARRKPGALKAAVVLAAYIGLPNLLSLSYTLDQVRSDGGGTATILSHAVWWSGMLGQVAVVWSCLSRLAPVQPLECSPAPSGDVGLPRE
jgi:hypothetical protein